MYIVHFQFFQRNVAHFGCPFEYHLVHTPMEGESLQASYQCFRLLFVPDSPSFPPFLSLDELCSRPVRLLLEVCSLDYWDRHRVEGYGYLDLPTTPGGCGQYLLYTILVYVSRWLIQDHMICLHLRGGQGGGA